MITLDDEECLMVSFALSCYLEDYTTTIRKEEKRQGKRLTEARKQHADLQRLQLTKINRSALCGKLQLMDGTSIEPVKS